MKYFEIACLWCFLTKVSQSEIWASASFHCSIMCTKQSCKTSVSHNSIKVALSSLMCAFCFSQCFGHSGCWFNYQWLSWSFGWATDISSSTGTTAIKLKLMLFGELGSQMGYNMPSKPILTCSIQHLMLSYKVEVSNKFIKGWLILSIKSLPNSLLELSL